MLCFFFNDTATTEIYPLSLHDALPICTRVGREEFTGLQHLGGGLKVIPQKPDRQAAALHNGRPSGDRKSTRLNSSHSQISYAVFCLKKKNDLDRRSTGEV